GPSGPDWEAGRRDEAPGGGARQSDAGVADLRGRGPARADGSGRPGPSRAPPEDGKRRRFEASVGGTARGGVARMDCPPAAGAPGGAGRGPAPQPATGPERAWSSEPAESGEIGCAVRASWLLSR